MADFYGSNDYIKFDGTIHGGLTIQIHEPRDLDVIQSACAMAARSSEPMHVLYGLLSTDPQSRYLPYVRMPDAELNAERLSHEAWAMYAAMQLAMEIREGHREDEIGMVVSVARPETRRPTLEIESRQPALVLHQGSLLATVALGSLRVGGFAITLFSGRGVGRSQRAERILEDTRRRALTRPSVEPLERLDEQQRGAYRDKSAVIILLHGLLSTDAGLFDPLIRKLMGDRFIAETCAIVGWPHDTLTGIEVNAIALRSLIDQIIGLDGPEVMFIAHSRGGLVARSTAAKLTAKNPRWAEKLRGCISFGTPHEGCPLAETPGDLLGKLICIQATRNTGSWLSFSDALTYIRQTRQYQGIDDLRPINGGGEFLKQLLEVEAKSAPDGFERALDIVAVGGRASHGGMLGLLSNRALATAENDLVVETRSSVPRLYPQREVTDCDHFSYFTESEMEKSHIDAVLMHIRERLHFKPPFPRSRESEHQPRMLPPNWTAAEA